MSVPATGWREEALERIVTYRDALAWSDRAKNFHDRRNGLYGDDYVRPGLSVEIPLFWGTF